MPLTDLLYYFPSGTTEGERHILREAFVHEEEFAELMTPPPFSPRLLIGKKGSGKSALIEAAQQILNEGGIPAVVIRPVKIELTGVADESAIGDLTRSALAALVRAISAALGTDTRIVLTGHAKDLYEEAILAGETRRDWVEKAAAVLPALARPWTPVDLSALLPGSDQLSIKRLADAIAANLRQSGRGFYLFIDDTDQIAAPERPSHINRIWALILAARELTQMFPELRCIVSIREEVWRRITHHKAGQRDQTDHFAALERYLNPTRKSIEQIVNRRVRLAAQRAGFSDAGNPFDLFFEGHYPKMPSSIEVSSWLDLVCVRSRGRPRDAIQLINALTAQAQIQRMEKITERHFTEVMPEFSKKRVELISQELEEECAQTAELFRLLARLPFDQGSFKISTESIRKELKEFPSGMSIVLFGKTLNPGNDDDALALLGFFFTNGIVNARVADSREKDKFRHIDPNDEPNFVSKARWNDLQATIWEIHPAYRDYLIEVQAELRARFGLPPTRRS